MTVDNNQLSGNFGDDILFQSFVSTNDPNSGTAWDPVAAPPVFDPTGYQSDPLARLDLHFRNNTFDTQDFNNENGVGTGNNQFVAFYNNADGVFKSRLNNIVAGFSPSNGPFNNASRRRNAQRQAARISPYTTPTSLVGSTFLYPGLGDSTFRVSSDSDYINTVDNNPFNGFLVDPVIPNTSATFLPDQNGLFIPIGPFPNGEQPFGWGQF
jgi:hypothetical protein